MTIQITFVPAWAANVVSARGAAFKDTLNTLSVHDHFHFLLANHLFKTRLLELGFKRDEFTNIADKWDKPYTEADVLFALYGANKDKNTVTSWSIKAFDSYTDPGVGYTVVENPSADKHDLLSDYIHQVDMLEGRQQALMSSAFKHILERHHATLAI